MNSASTVWNSKLLEALALTESLAGSLSEAQLLSRIKSARSNSIGSQFWCIVGARESYSKAIAAGAWQGFSCSLGGQDAKRLPAVQAALARSRTQVLESVANSAMTDTRLGILIELLEHEAQHQGQLIRYFYANAIRFPEDFARRYALVQPAQ